MVLKTITYAEAAQQALRDAMMRDPSVVVVGEDVGRGGIFQQYKGLQAEFGSERIIDAPISENAIAGVGVGMALIGLRPVVELRIVDFALCAMDEIVNQAAKNRFMFGGQGRVPAILRMPIGHWGSSAAQHSQSLEAWFAHLPGVTVMCPATPQDNYTMLSEALKGEDPVVYMEHKELWSVIGPVDTASALEIGPARVLRQGDDLTLVSWSAAVRVAEQAATVLSLEGISASVIDLRSIWPWDRETVLADCARTRNLLVVHESVQVAGFGAEVAATAAQATGCRIARMGAPRIPVGYAKSLEVVSRIQASDVVQAALAMFGMTRVVA
ncbi:alpha-ketoacid dehydrogenase subunit beta [Burkholderia sp. Bp8998]|uniref:alpha-ketoacid dehydrogenase subunit beta n=1 Tax=Burkholderia sp. Bp8998 TaxID=2184557 RepID=UPI000F59951E|nr:transketolase C-terminal domain-containing protein [Burkholderia sp. Bp8998]RQS05774.1 alpha-ketoacid dehydrogenase subunit beta [Burkholderia sp. Bp8998]